jgi:integrase/recombinase XerD
MHKRRSSPTGPDYVRIISRVAGLVGRSSNPVTLEDTRPWRLFLPDLGVYPLTFNSAAAALRFFLTITFDRLDLSQGALASAN